MSRVTILRTNKGTKIKDDGERKYHLNKIAKCLLQQMAKELLDNEDNKENEENVF